jgi:hypothetical protein
MKNRSFTMALPDVNFDELQELADRYNQGQRVPLNRLNIQDVLRLIVKAHLQEIRGTTKVEEMRLKSFSVVKFHLGKCPSCKLRVDKQDFPVLVVDTRYDESGEQLECQICGNTCTITDVG